MSSESGGYDNRLTDHAFPFFESASFFQSNYAWGTAIAGRSNYPQLSYDVLKNHYSGKQLEDARSRVFQGLYCATQGGSSTPPYEGNFFPSYALIDAPQTPPTFYTGLNIYYPAWVMYDFRASNTHKNTDKLPDREFFHNNDSAFWNGSREFINWPKQGNNPVAADKCMAHYLGTPRSTITEAPFVCWFNDGEGDYYNVDGAPMSTGPWNNLSDQSVLPAYRYAAPPISTIKKTGLQHTEQSSIFTGGSSLSFDFNSTTEAWSTLFEVNLTPTSTMSIVITAKVFNIESVNLVLSVPSFPPNFYAYSYTESLAYGWINYVFQLSTGMPAASRIGLKIERQSGGSFYLGKFSFLDTQHSVPSPKKLEFRNLVDVLDWSLVYNNRSHYRIYGVINGVRTLIAVAHNSAYRVAINGRPVPHNLNTGVGGFTSYIVQEVNAEGIAANLQDESLYMN